MHILRQFLIFQQINLIINCFFLGNFLCLPNYFPFSHHFLLRKQRFMSTVGYYFLKKIFLKTICISFELFFVIITTAYTLKNARSPKKIMKDKVCICSTMSDNNEDEHRVSY